MNTNSNSNSKLVNLFNERLDDYINIMSNIKLKYTFNMVKGKCYKLTIKLTYGNVIDMNIMLLFDKLVGITYDKNFVKIKTLYYNHLEEHTLLNYETLDANIDRHLLCEWSNIKGMLFEIYCRLIAVLEKIMDKEVIEKVEEQPDLLDLEIEEEIEEIVIGQST
jgi:hypothetical protein